MSDVIIVALIGLIGSGLGAFGGILVSSKLTQYRLEQLEKKWRFTIRLSIESINWKNATNFKKKKSESPIIESKI